MRAADVAAEVGRSCGKCDLCCIVHGVPGTTEAGKRCPFMRQGTVTVLEPDGETTYHPQHGCKKYDRRPRMCETWFCAWLLGLGGLDDRPDRTGVIPDFVGPGRVRLTLGPEDLFPDYRALILRAIDLALRILSGTAGKKWGPMQLDRVVGRKEGENEMSRAEAAARLVCQFITGPDEIEAPVCPSCLSSWSGPCDADCKRVEAEARAELLVKALAYAGHNYGCDARKSLWHRGPCDCGWAEVEEQFK